MPRRRHFTAVMVSMLIGAGGLGCTGGSDEAVNLPTDPAPSGSSAPLTKAGRAGAIAGAIACAEQRLPSDVARRESQEAILVRHGLDQSTWRTWLQELELDPEFQQSRDAALKACQTSNPPSQVTVMESIAHVSVVSRCMREAGFPPGQRIELLQGALSRAGVSMDVYLREVAGLSRERAFQALVDEASASCAVILDTLPTPRQASPAREIGDGDWEGVITGRGAGTFRVKVQSGHVVDATADLEGISFILSGRIFEDRSIILAGRSDVYALQLRGRFERASEPSEWKLSGRWEADFHGGVKRGRWTSRRP